MTKTKFRASWLFLLRFSIYLFIIDDFGFRFGRARRDKEWGYVNLVVLPPCDKFLLLTQGYLYIPAALKAAPVTSLGELGFSCPLQAPQFISLN